MFDNGSFLRRRKRYKRPSFPGHWSNMLDPYTRKLLSQYTFQQMHGGGAAGGLHSGNNHMSPHPPPPPPPSSHLHPGFIPPPLLMSGGCPPHHPNARSNGQMSPPISSPYGSGLPPPPNLNLPPHQNHLIHPTHPMIAAAACAAQLANLPSRHASAHSGHAPPPPSVGFPPLKLPLNSSSATLNLSERSSPTRSPDGTCPSAAVSPHIVFGNASLTSPSSFQSILAATSKGGEELSSSLVTSSMTTSLAKSSMRSPKGSGFTIDNIIGAGEQGNKTFCSNNNHKIDSHHDTSHIDSKENKEGYGKHAPISDKNIEPKCNKYDEEEQKKLKTTSSIKVENCDSECVETSNNNSYDDDDDDDTTNKKTSSNLVKLNMENRDGEEADEKLNNAVPHLPSFFQSAMLGKIAETTDNKKKIESSFCYSGKEEHNIMPIPTTQMQTSLFKTITAAASWKQHNS